MSSEKNKVSVLATYITPAARKICEKIAEGLNLTVIIKPLPAGKIHAFFEEAFKYDAIIAVMAAGIVVRGIAPFIKSKLSDPAVIVIDEKGKYVISLLSGHIGGGNRLAQEVAGLISAQPVITTATDVNELPAIDVYAKEMDYVISDMSLCKKVSMALLDGKKIPVYVEQGEPKTFFKPPFVVLNKKEFLNTKGLKIAVSKRILPGVIEETK